MILVWGVERDEFEDMVNGGLGGLSEDPWLAAGSNIPHMF